MWSGRVSPYATKRFEQQTLRRTGHARRLLPRHEHLCPRTGKRRLQSSMYAVSALRSCVVMLTHHFASAASSIEDTTKTAKNTEPEGRSHETNGSCACRFHRQNFADCCPNDPPRDEPCRNRQNKPDNTLPSRAPGGCKAEDNPTGHKKCCGLSKGHKNRHYYLLRSCWSSLRVTMRDSQAGRTPRL